MHLEPQVNRAKYDEGVSTLVAQQAALEARGVFLLSSTRFPYVELLFAPRHPVQIPMFAPPVLNLPQGSVITPEVPSLAARAFKAHFDLTDFDLRAPSLEFRDPWTDQLVVYGQMSPAFEFDQERKNQLVLLGEHPNTHKPFLCLRGIREYHEHPQHAGDDWLLYRNEMNLFAIVMNVWRACVDLVHPQLSLLPNAISVTFGCEEKL